MTGFLQRFFPARPRPVDDGGLYLAAAERFAQWASRAAGTSVRLEVEAMEAVDCALERAHEQAAGGALSEAMAADAAAFLGEAFRRRWGGQWMEDDRFGLVLGTFQEFASSRLMVLPLVEKKWSDPLRFKLAAFFTPLEKRIDSERSVASAPVGSIDALAGRLRGKSGDEAQREVDAIVTEFRLFWRRRHQVEIPLTLIGVRELDRFLRTYYFICFLEDATLAAAGLFLGDVGRGLFEGRWNFEQLGPIEEAALRFPELDYLPVGRVFKMMAERPEGEPLDEYLRLIPSARRELARRG